MGDQVEQLALINAPVGGAGSGAARYGAAMHFYMRGEISADMLEIYRCCSKFDNEDPVAVARFEGVAVPDFLGIAP